jgi:hypothetical protein
MGAVASTPNKLGMNPNSFSAVSKSSLDADGAVSLGGRRISSKGFSSEVRNYFLLVN